MPPAWAGSCATCSRTPNVTARDVVRLRLARDGGTALLDVDNDGPPVAVEDRDRIFGRFVRLDDSRTRDTGGTGLGLAIVVGDRQVARGHRDGGDDPGGLVPLLGQDPSRLGIGLSR